MSKRRRAVIIGGHSTPALALTAELQQRGWKIYYFGSKYTSLQIAKLPSYEFQTLCRQENVCFVPLRAASWPRRLSWSQISNIWLIIKSFFKSLLSLIKINPKIVIGFGGYLAPPVVFAAWLLRVPVIVHEQTTVLGLANRFCLLFAKKIAVAFPGLKKEMVGYRPELIGNLLRPEVMNPDKSKVRIGLRRQHGDILYITGGKTGSVTLNNFVAHHLKELLSSYCLIHQTGELQFGRFKKLWKSLTKGQRQRYFPLATLNGNEVGWVLSQTKLAISRSGANTVSELAWWQTPSILVPLPVSAGREQEKNAQWLVNLGLAKIVPQNALATVSKRDLYELKNLKKKKKLLRDIHFILANSRQKFADLVEETARNGKN